MSLYLTHRPKHSHEVVGQERLEPLFKAIDEQRFVHAYLFSGPRGTGKTTVSRILARSIACRNDQDIQEALQGNFPDIIEIDGASNRKIEQAKALQEKINFSPLVGKAKVYIIDEVHMLTKEAFNALLKTLEEPPSHVYFILATTEIHKVLDTIRSRCQHFQFLPLKENVILEQLRSICDKEHITYEEAALKKISYHANGGMRDALSLMEKCILDSKITESTTTLLLGGDYHDTVIMMYNALREQNAENILETIQEVIQQGQSPDEFLKTLLQYSSEQIASSLQEGRLESLMEVYENVMNTYSKLKDAPSPHFALYLLLHNTKKNTLQESSNSPQPLTLPTTPPLEKKEKKTTKSAPTQDTPPIKNETPEKKDESKQNSPQDMVQKIFFS